MRKFNVFLWAFWSFLVVSYFACQIYDMPEFDKILLGATVCSYFFSVADLCSFFYLRHMDFEKRMRDIAWKLKCVLEINNVSVRKGIEVEPSLTIEKEEQDILERELKETYGFIKQQIKIRKMVSLFEKVLIFIGLFSFFVSVVFYESKFECVQYIIVREKYFSMFAFIMLIGCYMLKDSILIADIDKVKGLSKLFNEFIEEELFKLELSKVNLMDEMECEIEEHKFPRNKIKFKTIKENLKRFINDDLR